MASTAGARGMSPAAALRCDAGGVSDEVDPAGAAPAAPRSRRWRRPGRIGGAVLSVAIIVGVFALALPKIADYGEVWGVWTTLGAGMAVALAAVAVVNVLSFAPPWLVALPGLHFIDAVRMTQASTAASLVAPGGPAVGITMQVAMLRSRDLPARAIALAVGLVGFASQLAIYGLPVIALLGLTASGGRDGRLDTVAVVGLAMFTGIVLVIGAWLSSGRLAHRMGELAARVASTVKGWVNARPVAWGGDSFRLFRAEALALLRRRWPMLTVTTLGNALTDLLVLTVSLRAVGIAGDQVSLIEVFAAWSVVRVLAEIPLTPGGLGVVEVALSGILVGFGAPNDAAVAGVLLYRFLQFAPTLGVGLVAGATWRKRVGRGTPPPD